MTEGEEHQEQPAVATKPVGERLRAAREAAGLTLSDIAQRTRVSARFLDAIENGNYAELPGMTYCAGFVRAYARAVNLDEVALIADLREEIDGDGARSTYYVPDEPADPARVPPRLLAWIALALLVLIIAGYGIFRMQNNTPPVGNEVAPAMPVAQQQGPVTVAAPRRPAGPSATSPVVLTATGEVWLRIYDDTGVRLMEKSMAAGESYTVPPNANNPMILTGRPNMLRVTVGGVEVAPLGPPERTVADLPVSAAALLARPSAPVPAGAAPATSNPPSGQ